MTRRATMLAALPCALSLLLASCGDDGDALPGACDNASCPSECTALAGETCDTLQSACQHRIFDAVQCVRGTAGELPEIRVLTLEEYEAELEPDPDAGLDASVDASGDAGVHDGGLAPGEALEDGSLEHWSRALQLLGLLAADTTTGDAFRQSSIDNTAGYYSAAHQRITLVDRGEPQDSPQAQTALAHELVHALQDQQLGLFELGERAGDVSDSVLAYRCLIEGDAQLYAQLARALLNGLSVDPRHQEVRDRRYLKYSRSAVLRDASPYASTQWLVYPVGEALLTDAWLDGGSWAVQSLYDAPPSTSVFWMRGYEDRAERARSMRPLIEPLACDRAELPTSEHEQVRQQSLGAMHVFTMLGTAMRDDGIYPTEEAWAHARGWRMDSLEVFAGPSNDTALSWRMRFGDAEVVERIAAAIEARVDAGGSPLKLRAEGPELELLAADDDELLDAWRGTDPQRCPAAPEDGT